MKVRGPLDLPDFRLWLMDQWHPHGEFSRMSRGNAQFPFTWDSYNVCPTPSPEVQRHALPKAALWWVAEEMSALIDHAARSLPSTTLTDDLLPSDNGLVVFSEPLMGMAADTGEAMDITALTWARVGIPEKNPKASGRWIGTRVLDGLSIVPYRWHPKGSLTPTGMVPVDGPVKPDRVATIAGKRVGVIYGPEKHEHWNPAGSTHWIMDLDTDFAEDGETETQIASLSEDRRWLAALWLLAAQPLATSRVEPAERAVARRSKRARVTSDVRLVDLRRQAAGRQGEHEPRGGSRRPASYRYVVGDATGGFWRQQAYGPGWSQHRPQWILPFVKGPKDKPLRLRETVNVVRGDP